MALVDTKYGQIEGTREGDLDVFRGIPFAKPPVGDLRFSPPQKLDVSTETIRATEFGCPAPQIVSKFAPDVSEGMSEDCLTLNVWSPGCDDGRRPVMVWIHGGSFLVGSSKNAMSNGAQISERGDIVVVSLNYRVGAFGFLHLAGVAGSKFASSGNNGLLDQIAGLEWVQDNIAGFGGDPNNVTVFGCSAGGISISALMTMPAASGLFHRAITQSGAALARSEASALTAADEFMAKAGVSDLDGLRGLSMEAIIDAQAAALNISLKPDVFFGPVVDGVSIPEPPLHAIAAGRAMNVPMLTGTTTDEMRFWLRSNPKIVRIAPDKIMHVLHRLTGDGAESLLESHKEQRPAATDDDMSAVILSDMNFTMPALRTVEAHSARQPASYLYLFAWESPVDDGLYGAPHAIEQPFIFGTMDSPFAQLWVGDGDGRDDLSRRVQDAWIAFAKASNPNHEGLPNWPSYDANRRGVMRFDNECEVVDDPLGDIRRCWDGVPFDGIAPPVGVRPASRK